MKNKDLLIKVIQCIMALALFALACYFYIVYRSENMVLYSWIGINYHCTFFELLRQSSHDIPGWMIYNLPDALWLLSYLLIIDLFWERWCIPKLCFLALAPLFAIILEILQFVGHASGTGDYFDILSYTSALVVYGLIVQLKKITL